MKKEFKIKSKVWLFPGDDAWHFLTIPKNITKEIDYLYASEKRGFGSLPVKVTINKTNWKTSIFPNRKTGTFMLPLKKEVRKENSIKNGDNVSFTFKIDLK
jgi:hypothetical protein